MRMEGLRKGFYAGLDRLRDRGWPVVQTAVAAGLAYFLARFLLGHEQPTYAAVAAVITLGAAVGWAVNRAAQVVVGVTAGLLLAEALVLFVIGSGSWQISAVLALAMGAVVFFGGGPLLLTQIAITVITVVAALAPEQGFTLERVFDALVGIGVALAVGVLLPVDPEKRILRTARPVLSDLATILEDATAALEGRDREKAGDALSEARQADERVDQLRASIEAARDTARLSPLRRRSLGTLEAHVEVAEGLDLAVPNVRVLARSALRLLRRGEAAPPDLNEAVLDLSRSVRALDSYLKGSARDLGDARRYALAAARGATGVLDEHRDLAISALVGQVRSTAVDLLGATGMDYAEALGALEEAVGGPPADAPQPIRRPNTGRSA